MPTSRSLRGHAVDVPRAGVFVALEQQTDLNLELAHELQAKFGDGLDVHFTVQRLVIRAEIMKLAASTRFVPLW